MLYSSLMTRTADQDSLIKELLNVKNIFRVEMNFF